MKPKYGDARVLTFSQAQGYEELPQRLKLEELSEVARTKIWNTLFPRLDIDYHGQLRDDRWIEILVDAHTELDNLPVDEWGVGSVVGDLRDTIMTRPFNKVFDLIQFILRHSHCPTELVDGMKKAFEKGMVAYVIDDSGPPTIFPACTKAEGQFLAEALHTLQQGGLRTAEGLFRNAAAAINRRNWTGSVDNSISAAESVARTLEPGANTFGEVLRELRRNPSLWSPQLVQAMQNIWNYTNQRNTGIRHGSPEPTDENVGVEEALFMLGTCAAVASYLWRKHPAGEKSKKRAQRAAQLTKWLRST